jgi:hypothetical protein
MTGKGEFKMIRTGLVSAFLIVLCLHCSGCATLLGGIIGYQSAELCAGLAIGAAVDFGDDVARGIGQMSAKEESFCQEYIENTDLNAAAGTIRLPITPFNKKRVFTIISRLEETLEKNGWSQQIMEKTSRNSWFGSHLYQKWHCTTPDQRVFDLEIRYNSDRDTELMILDCSEENRIEFTNQIYEWMKEGLCFP